MSVGWKKRKMGKGKKREREWDRREAEEALNVRDAKEPHFSFNILKSHLIFLRAAYMLVWMTCGWRGRVVVSPWRCCPAARSMSTSPPYTYPSQAPDPPHRQVIEVCCTAPNCIVSCCTVSYCTVLCCIPLYRYAPYCTILHCVVR